MNAEAEGQVVAGAAPDVEGVGSELLIGKQPGLLGNLRPQARLDRHRLIPSPAGRGHRPSRMIIVPEAIILHQGQV
jgi:hypothetical protein